MKSLLCHAFGIRGCRYLATRHEKGEIIFELEPEDEPRAPEGQKLLRRGFRWRKVRAVSMDFKPVWVAGQGAEVVQHHHRGGHRFRLGQIARHILADDIFRPRLRDHLEPLGEGGGFTATPFHKGVDP